MRRLALNVVLTALVGWMLATTGHAEEASFSELKAKIEAGGPVTVVFFGGSLTWGTNASDPQQTSYRGRMMEYLATQYPKTAFRFHDAAIGGTGSVLGVFRLDRDVIRFDPDLVFLDFTANDGLYGTDRETLACYETLLREMIGCGIPVVQLCFGFRYNFGKGYNLEKLTRRRDHLQLAAVYHTGVGDLFPIMQAKLIAREGAIAEFWPFDGAHPDDGGYAIFFEAAKQGLEAALSDGRVCTLPEKPIFANQAVTRQRILLAETDLPEGWTRGKTYRTSIWFDGLSSRWMGDVVIYNVTSKTIAPLKVPFKGRMVGLLGEANEIPFALKIKIDGKELPRPVKKGKEMGEEPTWPWTTSRFTKQGNLFFWQLLAKDLAPGEHLLEVEPVIPEGVEKGQLRIESVCAAEE